LTSLDRRSRLPRAIVALALRHPFGVLVGWACVAAIAGLGVVRLDIETTTDSVLDRQSEPWRYYQHSQEVFGGDEILTVLIHSATPFDPVLLGEVVSLSERFESLPGVRRVDSLATVPMVSAAPDGSLSLEPALRSKDLGEPEIIGDVRQRVRRDRIARRNLISADEQSFAINLVLERGADPQYRHILSSIASQLSGTGYWVSGVPVYRVEADARTQRELLELVPLTIVVIGGLLYILFGTIKAIWIPMLASGLASWTVLGAMGALGVPVTISTMLLPSILLALGCAYCMHILNATVGRDGEGAADAMLNLALPVSLSGLTTAVGFVAVSFVPIDAVRDVGGFGAFGVLVALLATLTVAPAAIKSWPLEDHRPGFRTFLSERLGPILVRWVMRRRGLVVLAWGLVGVAMGVGAASIRIETDVTQWFKPDDPVRVSYSEIRDRLSGISPMNVVIDAAATTTVTDPKTIEAIDGLARYLDEQEGVGRVISVGDPLRQIHGGFTGDLSDPLPNERALIEQYLLLLEAKPYVYDLVTADRTAANVRIRVDDNGSDALLRVAKLAQDWWADHGPPGTAARATGIMYEFGRAEDAIARGQIRGLVFAAVAIGAIMLLMYRSLRVAAVALVPNAVPIGIAFGAMGLLGIPLDAGTVMLGNLALGIAVDDTIHVASGFVRETEHGKPPLQSLIATMRQVLPPVVYSTLAVGLGFAVLGVSGFTLIRNMGLLTASLMLLCLAADVLLFPALLGSLRLQPGAATPRDHF
jgi:predicted RND superfamily exporter protein